MAFDISGALLKSGSAAVRGITSSGTSAHLILKARVFRISRFTLLESKKFKLARFYVQSLILSAKILKKVLVHFSLLNKLVIIVISYTRNQPNN